MRSHSSGERQPSFAQPRRSSQRAVVDLQQPIAIRLLTAAIQTRSPAIVASRLRAHPTSQYRNGAMGPAGSSPRVHRLTLHDPRAMFVARTLGGLNNVKRFVVGALALGVALATDGASGQSPASTQTPAPDPTPSPTPGQTQIVTSTGIICGADEVSFDAISGPTEGANPARLYARAQNYAYLSEAMTNCDSNA